MMKRARLVASTDTFDLRDRISQLPDDVRVSILSRLTLKEAVRTGILSKQWRHLWTRVTILDFNADESLGVVTADPRSDNVRRAKYVDWVNCVISQMQSQTTTLNELRICFYLNKSFITAIDNWVEFAFKRIVQKLVLDFPLSYYDSKPYYSFPVIPRQVNILTGFESLKDLSLRHVNVCDEALESVLSHCLFLEYLSIYASVGLKNVKICGSSLKLKHVGICGCYNIVSVEISNAPKLVSFDYCRIAKLKMDNVPMLEKILIGVGEPIKLVSVLPIMSSLSNQLRVLTLDIVNSQKHTARFDIPQFPKLQVLVIRHGAWWDRSLLDLIKVVRACPNLPKFVLELVWYCPSKQRRPMIQAPKCELKSLRLLEIKGYYGRKSELELFNFFIENASSLEKIVIDPKNQMTDEIVIFNQNHIDEAAIGRRHAMKHVRPKVPSGVDLVIL